MLEDRELSDLDAIDHVDDVRETPAPAETRRSRRRKSHKSLKTVVAPAAVTLAMYHAAKAANLIKQDAVRQLGQSMCPSTPPTVDPNGPVQTFVTWARARVGDEPGKDWLGEFHERGYRDAIEDQLTNVARTSPIPHDRLRLPDTIANVNTIDAVHKLSPNAFSQLFAEPIRDAIWRRLVANEKASDETKLKRDMQYLGSRIRTLVTQART